MGGWGAKIERSVKKRCAIGKKVVNRWYRGIYNRKPMQTIYIGLYIAALGQDTVSILQYIYRDLYIYSKHVPNSGERSSASF